MNIVDYLFIGLIILFGLKGLFIPEPAALFILLLDLLPK